MSVIPCTQETGARRSSTNTAGQPSEIVSQGYK